MEIIFKTSRFEKIASDPQKFKKKYGEQLMEVFYRRIDDFGAVSEIDELYRLPGKHHPLHGDMKGMWACSLTANWRLLYETSSEVIDNEKVDAIKIILVEIEDYH